MKKEDIESPRIPKPPSLPRGMAVPPPIDPGPESGSPGSVRERRIFGGLTRLQVKRPALPLSIAAVLTAISIFFALRLEILTGFQNLLPESRPSVIELKRVAEKTAGISMVFVVLSVDESVTPPPTDALRRAADALVPALEKLGAPWVGSAESGVHRAVEFLAPRAGLFADKDKLDALRKDIDTRFEYEVRKATGTDLGFDDEVPPKIDLDRIRHTFGVDRFEEDRYPDGYYQSKDGRTVVVAIRSKVHGSELAAGQETIAKVRATIDQVDLASFDPRIRYGLTGDLVTATSEYLAINHDLRDVGLLGAILISGIMLLYYLRIRVILTLLVTILVGLAWTFGITELVVGHLNLATGFLFTIIAGNGLNPGIIYLARYLEARRDGSGLEEAIEIAHRQTWLPTLTAAAAASASFGSLVVTEFRGFRDFGLIGGLGMLICWVATFWTLPAVVAVAERIAPIDADRANDRGPLARLRRLTQGGVAFGAPFAYITKRFPRFLMIGGALLSVVGAISLVVYIKNDPMEYDLKMLRVDAKDRAEEIRLTQLAEQITGHVGSSGMAILVEEPAEVAMLTTELEKRRDAAPADLKPFKSVHALQDFVASDQEAKIPILLAIKKKVLKAQERGLFTSDEWDKIRHFVPPDDLTPFGMAALPEEIARPFTEADGTRGRVVYISPTSDELVDDARYLFRWADAYRETKLENGRTVYGSGSAVIYADMWTAVIQDVPKAVLCSLVAVIGVVLLAFRAGRPALAVLGGLLVGVLWMALVLVVLEVRLTFLNFIALPLTFGIGVDYAVNVVQRYVTEGAGSAEKAVRETGGAVILCSMTTTLGYLALVGSMNHSVRGLGIAAVIGELACLAAGVLVLPAFLVWVDRKRAHGSASAFSLKPPRLTTRPPRAT